MADAIRLSPLVYVCVWITLKIEIIVTFIEKIVKLVIITGYDYDYGYC